jgi:hypothetical protein
MMRTFIVGVQISGADWYLPTEEGIESILAQGDVKKAFGGPGRTVRLKLLTWPGAEWTAEEILEREG